MSGPRGRQPYVVLLRGVNVGRHNRITMADLRDLLTGLGMDDVRTVLQSGNAVVTGRPAPPAEVARSVEQSLRERFGLRAGCLVLTGADVQRVVADDPFGSLVSDGSRYLVIFLSGDPGPRLRREFDPAALDPERIRAGRRVIYQWCPDGILTAPPVGKFVERHWEVTATARNWNTISKVAAMVGAREPLRSADPGRRDHADG